MVGVISKVVFVMRRGTAEHGETNNVIAGNLVDFAPCVHDPTIIVCNDCNEINTLGFELAELVDIWRKVVCLAAWSESTYTSRMLAVNSELEPWKLN